MRIDELSIGDWVRFEDKSYKVIGIEKWRPNYVVVLEGWREICTRGIKCIEPILLTPEILEKNGFVKNGGYNEWNIGTWDSPNLIGVSLERPSIIVKQRGSRIFLNQANAVHQLQNALRLAGVGKEIEL